MEAQVKGTIERDFTYFLMEHYATPIGIIMKADEKIAALEKKLSDARAEIAGLKAAKCPVCKNPLPADGRCYVCMVKMNTAPTNSAAFEMGAKAVGLAVLAVRSFGQHPDFFYAIEKLIAEVVNHRDEPDRKKAAMAAAIALKQMGCYIDTAQKGETADFAKLCLAWEL